jgi:hypothetical protein
MEKRDRKRWKGNDPTMEYYIHCLPGRLRIKSPSLKKNPVEAEEMVCRLKEFPGVLESIVNNLTGSLIVIYDPKRIEEQTIIAFLEKKGHFKWEKAQTNDQYIQQAAAKATHWIWNATFGSFVGAALEGTPLAPLAVLI